MPKRAEDWMFGASLVLFLGGISIVGLVQLHAHNTCLTLGYPESKITYPALVPYCIKRVNQTDSVVALSKLKP